MDFTQTPPVVEYGEVTITRSQHSSDWALEVDGSTLHLNMENIPHLLQKASQTSGQNSDVTNALYILALGLQYTQASTPQGKEQARQQLSQASGQNVEKVVRGFRTAS